MGYETDPRDPEGISPLRGPIHAPSRNRSPALLPRPPLRVPRRAHSV